MTDLQPDLLTPAFRALSARLGSDPLQVQGPGGNTSIKAGNVMWIKASGKELADAKAAEIFVAVDRAAALAEAREEAGDGSCKATVLDPSNTLRPSIETTFHAALEHAVVVHTHSVATIVHVITPEGVEAARDKLDGLNFVIVPYAMPGLPLTREILARVQPETQVILLQNHGLICCGATVQEVSDLVDEVERRLAMPPATVDSDAPKTAAPDGFEWAAESWIAQPGRACDLVLSGSYYPDHVVFLGPALPKHDSGPWPAVLMPEHGIAIKRNATSSQRAMLRCISDVLKRLPDSWTATPIGPDAEAALLSWDAEKYRQKLSRGS